MSKLGYSAVLLLTLIIGVLGYRSYDSEYYKFCKSANRHANFKNLAIEEQYQIYIKYNCKYDSVSARTYWGFHIGEKEEAIEFLTVKLLVEKDQDALTQTLYILLATARTQEIKGRGDIFNLAKQTVDKISDKDERGLIQKLFGSEIRSRKEELAKVLEEIEDRTKVSKAEYQEKTDRELREAIQRKAEKAAREMIKKLEQNQANPQ